MSQISHPTMGSPHVMVTPTAELHVTNYSDGVGPAGIDKITYSTTTLEHEHHEIHDGNHFYIDGFAILQSGINPGLQVGLITPNTSTWSHFTWHLSSNGILISYLTEDANISGGVPIIPLNNNRNNINASSVTILQGVSGVGGTTIVSKASAGGAGFKSSVGGAISKHDELILKSGTTYRRDFYSASDDNIVAFKATWYEHINKS